MFVAINAQSTDDLEDVPVRKEEGIVSWDGPEDPQNPYGIPSTTNKQKLMFSDSTGRLARNGESRF